MKRENEEGRDWRTGRRKGKKRHNAGGQPKCRAMKQLAYSNRQGRGAIEGEKRRKKRAKSSKGKEEKTKVK